MKNKRSSTNNGDHVLVYSTDPVPPKKKESEKQTTPYALNPAMRLERKGRGGKSVTVLYRLPPHETLLKALAAYLKKTLGSGGTSYIKEGEGFVEVQGEHSASILSLASKFKWP